MTRGYWGERLARTFIVFALVLFPHFAIADSEIISAFTTHFEINVNGSVNVQEEIVYDFGPNAVNKHGIYREIPLQFSIPGERTARQIEISSIMVTDGRGNLRPSQYTGGGNYVSLKIGDPDVTVTGPQLYVIRYTVWGALISLPDKDEFYWNTTGEKWAEPILRARAEVVLPVPAQTELISHVCYAGPPQSDLRCTSTTTPDTIATESRMVVFEENAGLAPHFGMTIAVGVPKGIFNVPAAKFTPEPDTSTFWGKLRTISFVSTLLIPIATFVAMWRIWSKRGRDPKGRGVVIVAYDIPKHLGVLELAYLSKNTLEHNALSAALVDLAIRGYLTIERIVTKKLFIDTEDFRITFLKEVGTSKLSIAEKILYNEFRDHGDTLLLSSLSHKLTGLSAILGTQVAEDLTQKGYYTENPIKVGQNYFIAAVGLFFFGMFIPLLNIAIVMSAIIIFVFALLMPKRTEDGVLLVEEIAGFKEYLSVAEKDRIDFVNAPDKDPKSFERFLPYAMVFKVEKAWASKFKDIYTNKDSAHWYSGSGAFNAATLVAGMDAFDTSTASAFSLEGGGSSGGGSAGGGGGGGGGGSW